MLADLAGGHRDAVITYNLDRLTRQPMELEEFTRLCERAGVKQMKSVTADFDLGNDDGLFMARILGAIASKESARKSERLKRKAQQLAEQGMPNGGYQRPFGSLSRQLAQLAGSSSLDGLIGRGEQLRESWATLNLDRQSAIIKAVLDYATILPGTPGSRSLDPARIQPVWRL